MNGMEGNPHFEAAWCGVRGDEYEVQAALVNATLALAFEQRTANMIAFLEYAEGDDYEGAIKDITQRMVVAG